MMHIGVMQNLASEKKKAKKRKRQSNLLRSIGTTATLLRDGPRFIGCIQSLITVTILRLSTVDLIKSHRMGAGVTTGGFTNGSLDEKDLSDPRPQCPQA